jgi:hypothetical protein
LWKLADGGNHNYAPLERTVETVNKLLGLLVLGLAFTLGFGTVGCSKKDDKDKKDTAAADDKKKDDKKKDDKKKDGDEGKGKVEFKEVKEQKIDKKKETKLEAIEVVLAGKSPDEAKLTITVTDKDKKAYTKITGMGKVAKDSDKGTIDLVVGAEDATPGDYMVEVSADKGIKGKTSFKLKVE